MTRLATHAGPYALGTFRAGTSEFAGLVVGAAVYPIEDAAGLCRPSVRELLEHWEAVRPELEARWRQGGVAPFTLVELEVLPPVEPRQIFQSGANYRTHVMELAVVDRRPDDRRTDDEIRYDAGRQQDERAESGDPYIFAGAVSALCGAYDDVILPSGTEQNDFELELAVVIGAPARRVTPADALSYVAGYTIANDITSRDRLRRQDLPDIGPDWTRAKNAPTFLPTGPFLVPAEFVGDPMDLHITLRLNGQVMQDESTKDMIFDVAHLVSYCSHLTTLQPGDLILTGSPAGNGIHWGRLLQPGDVMESDIEGLGLQRNGCIAETAARIEPTNPNRRFQPTPTRHV